MVMRVTGRSRNGRAHLTARARAVIGSPLTKTEGEGFTTSWGAVNNGTVTGYVTLTVVPEGFPSLPTIGPVGVLPGLGGVTLSTVGGNSLTPGTHTVRITLNETTQLGGFIREIARDAGSVVVVPPAPPPATGLTAVGSPTIS